MNTQLIERLIGSTPWSAQTALEAGEMVEVGTVGRLVGVRVSRAAHEDCRGSRSIIRDLALAAASDGPGRPPRRVRILAPIRGKRGTRAAVVELVARSRGGWVEVREEGEG